jgi:hypothetical protein
MEDLGLSFWDRRRVFVRGSSGLLGSWLVEELLSALLLVSYARIDIR